MSPPGIVQYQGGHDSKNIFTIMSPPGIEQYQGGT